VVDVASLPLQRLTELNTSLVAKVPSPLLSSPVSILIPPELQLVLDVNEVVFTRLVNPLLP
jgi:hypothetical protein